MNLRFQGSRWIIFALVLALGEPVLARPAKNVTEPAYRGGLVSPPLPKPEFTLTDTSGAPYNFRARTDGYVTLLYFGYTHCTDVCPTQMQVIAESLKALSAKVASQVNVVFVTTDPERDTRSVLRAWLNHFDPHFVGLTGSDAAIRAAQIAAHLTPATKSAPDAHGNYDVGHSAFILAYTKDGLAHVVYPSGVQPQDWVHDLPYLVNETWTAR